MQRRRLWVILGVVVVVLAVCLWRFGVDRARTTSPTRQKLANVEPPQEPDIPALHHPHSPALPSTARKAAEKQTNISHNTPLLAYRLKNTERPLKELIYSDSAILLRNALFDAAEPAPLEIPPHLKAQGDPGSYVIQARGPVDKAFLGRLAGAGAAIISYIPNNAYLVRANEASAKQLAASPEIQSVLPWEPYFKLDLSLLARAVKQESLPEGERVTVVVFPGERDAGLKALEALGGHVIGEDSSPFGHQIIIQPRSDSLAELAQLVSVQSIEPYRDRVLMNDRSRVYVGVSSNTLATAGNYLGLSGSNVVVNVNDTGAAEAHPDLTGRILGLRFDNNGHGTHVAGTIVSSGANSPPNAPGSTNGASFRGIAPGAKVLSQGINRLTGPVSDSALQQSVTRSNVFISNNSWGYPMAEYNQNAASYDAAVRDAAPGRAGSQPVIFVFAAGNIDNSNWDGLGASSDQVASPATAKNVITVGALESLRNLTNRFLFDGETNMHFHRETDSDSQVAFYSARGNVGVGIEGDAGRFKPDVVAPGSWLISCRTTNWQDPMIFESFDPERLTDQFIERRSTNYYFRTIPDNATALYIQVLRNSQSPSTIPTLNIHTNLGSPPAVTQGDFAGVYPPGLVLTPVSPGAMWFALVNSNAIGVHFDLLTIVVTTNDFGEWFPELKKLNDQLAPYYRFESGTSMAAPVVSGTLALMQEFFEQRLGRTNSPALMKALLINGARSVPCVGCNYDLQVDKLINNQGWGAIRVTNSIPRALDGGSGTEPTWPMIMFDQDPDNALATGESHTYQIQLNPVARFRPLMITLVWTDPPGNPVASTKLVNDLDLIVTNLTTRDFYIGNNFPQGSHFTQPNFADETNAEPYDVVNNVENVFIRDFLAPSYSVTVRARRVNVNAFTDHIDGIRQDYALVISCGDSSFTNTFTTVPPTLAKGPDIKPFVQSLSNKVARFDQRVGANSPLLPVVSNNVPGPSSGNIEQWNFYVFNNTNPSHTNVAFITFLAPDLSLPRIREADIDMYATQDPALTNLNPGAIAGSLKSLTRGGTELIVIPNAGLGEYYIGVKSEDQQAASFAIFAVAQERPFGERDNEGNLLLDFFAVGDQCVPDGSPEKPSGVRFFAIVADPFSPNVRRIILTNEVNYELGGDMLSTLTSANGFAGPPLVTSLNNHRQFVGFQSFVYDDSGEDDIPGSRQSDGPGSLRDFEGRPANGLWQFTMVDNSPFHSDTACITRLFGRIEPQEDTNTMGNGVVLTIGAGKWRYTAVDIPLGATNLQVFVTHEPNGQAPSQGPIDVYIRRLLRPNTGIYDKKGTVQPPGGVVEHGRYDVPSLQSGRYHIGLHNPNSFPVRLRLRIEFQYALRPLETVTYISTPFSTIPDDLTTNFVIGVTNARNVGDVKVGVRIDHPRLSDLVLHLVSPEGTRVLLTENRGLSLGTNYGEGVPIDFIVPFSAAGGPIEARTNINTFNRQAIVRIAYDFFNVADRLRVYYEGERIFDSGYVSGAGVFNIPFGPGLSTFVELVMNEGDNPTPGTMWTNLVSVTGPWNYAIFSDHASLGGPIKFAFPPFSRIPTNIVVFSNGFENALAGIYATNPNPPAVTTVDDWGVRSNSVAVLSATTTNVARDGTNFLALSHGAISRGITNLVSGREYILNFAHRKISSSPTQSVTAAVTARTTPYFNLTSPPPAGSVSAVAVPKLRVCPGQDVTVISTNEVVIAGVPYTARGDTNNLVYGWPRYGLIGCWSTHPTTLNPFTMAAAPFYIGGGLSNGVVVGAPSEPGDYYLFLGLNRDDYTTPLVTGVFTTDVRWAQCQLANADYVVGTTPVDLDGTWHTNWATESLFFVANPTSTNFGFRADHNATILLDSIVIDELVPSAHYQSEEPLAPLKGQTALGNWMLEVTDNRTGPPVASTNSTLLSWSLNFIFEDGPNPVGLTNGIPYNARIFGGQVHYYVVSVPAEINTNRITFNSGGVNGGVELLYSTAGLPEGSMPPDPILPLTEGFSPFGVSSNYPVAAPITPGRQYFLAIRNVDSGTAFNDYSIRVDFLNVPIAQLLSGVPVTGNIAPLPATFRQTRNNSTLAVQNMDYYYFDVGANDPGITNLFFEVTSPTGAGLPNVHLVASRALPVSDLYPRPTFYEYHSTETTAPDKIIISSNSIPVPGRRGSRWYLGVYNVGSTNVDYSIRAQEAIAAPVFGIDYLDLAGGDTASRIFTVPPGNAINSFYHFITRPTDAAVLFEIYALNRDVDLIVRRSDVPSRDLYDFSFLSTGPTLIGPLPGPGPGPSSTNTVLNTGYEPIPLRTNIFIPTLGVNTNWYLAIANRGTLTSTGRLCVKVFNTLNPLVGCSFNARLTAPVTPGGPFDICWDSVAGTVYDIEVTTDMVNWVPVVTGFVASTANSCVGIPPATPAGFYRIRAY